MSYQQTYNIPATVKGDTFIGQEFTLTVNGTLADLSGALISMQLKESRDALVMAVLTLDNNLNGGITITDAVNGVFCIDEQIIDVPSLCYVYDIQITFQDGTVKTYIKGRWDILPEVTV